jgi:hypothetical protein
MFLFSHKTSLLYVLRSRGTEVSRPWVYSIAM